MKLTDTHILMVLTFASGMLTCAIAQEIISFWKGDSPLKRRLVMVHRKHPAWIASTVLGCAALVAVAIAPVLNQAWNSSANSGSETAEVVPAFQPAPQEMLDALPDMVFNIPKAKGFCLTYDDGPTPGKTEAVLESLEQGGVKASFAVLGRNAKAYPELLKKISESGHQLIVHGWTHKSMLTLSQEELDKEIEDTVEVIREVTGQEPRFLRPPYGAINEELARYIREKHSLIVLRWDNDSNDWRGGSPQEIAGRVILDARDGGVALLHDRVEATAAATSLIIQGLPQHEFLTIDGLVQKVPPNQPSTLTMSQ